MRENKIHHKTNPFSNLSTENLLKVKQRLTSELALTNLPSHRKSEIESYLYYLGEYLKFRKEQESNEAIHQQMGVDGWQEIYAEAPSEEDIRKEMAESIKEEIEDEERQKKEMAEEPNNCQQ